MPKYTDKPKNKLPRATGMSEHVFTFSQVQEDESDRIRYWGHSFEQAYQNPCVTQRRYLEENGYEYEERVTWFPKLNFMVTNKYNCPNRSAHHVDSTCPVCGQKN